MATLNNDRFKLGHYLDSYYRDNIRVKYNRHTDIPNQFVLIGNWKEEQADKCHRCRQKVLPSQYDHNYETTYRKAYNSIELKVEPFYDADAQLRAFPGHHVDLAQRHDFKHGDTYVDSTYHHDFVNHIEKARDILAKKKVVDNTEEDLFTNAIPYTCEHEDVDETRNLIEKLSHK